MIKEVLVDSETRWECQSCGKCCHNLGDEASLHLFGEKTKEDGACPNLDERSRCSIYADRPFGCKMYPFYPSWIELKKGKVDFLLGALKIDSCCPGYGKGTLVVKNKKIFKKLEKVAVKLKENIRNKPEGKIKDLFHMI